MLTIFALPKPFRGHVGIIQRNAVQSWLRLRPSCQIVLLGDDEGTADVARDCGVEHIAGVVRNEYGTPLVSSVFAQAERIARFPYLGYVNADLILTSDFLPAVQRVLSVRAHCLVVGRRWNLDVRDSIDYSEDWEQHLRALVARQGRLQSRRGVDYFVFPRGLWDDIPPFALGRSMWDNWLVYRAHSRGVPVVDVTPAVTVVHQNHDYSHHPSGEAGIWDGPEAQRNMALAGGYAHAFTVWDAHYTLTPKGVRRNVGPYIFYRTLVSASESFRFLRPMVRLIRRMSVR